ncbi:hypothetical protein Pyn_35557 [Prunus yedoensis var. nudiflora]|uniref:Uncharacterized protein n=1 Tax=Prunus yedoensis var. nudiflora TaxID=2094558 RepID=A0A314Y4H5_PRUYE|nr:hypothetical protein Pyn_15947 [Prunus yedoensis var. nudiflora]PQP98793.1 hypothetical protein Pyn_35557 [Prunus yedoensis var. nudiflora]
MDQHKTDDNLRYVGGLTRVLAADASISFADLRCQLPDEGVQNADADGDCKKKEDEDDFSFACSNPDGSFLRHFLHSKGGCSELSSVSQYKATARKQDMKG